MSKSRITATLVTTDQQMMFYANIVLKLYEIMALQTLLHQAWELDFNKWHERITVMVDWNFWSQSEDIRIDQEEDDRHTLEGKRSEVAYSLLLILKLGECFYDLAKYWISHASLHWCMNYTCETKS